MKNIIHPTKSLTSAMDSTSTTSATMNSTLATLNASAESSEITKRTEAQMKHLDQLASELDQAVRNLSTNARQYNRVIGLVTYWSDETSDRKHVKIHAIHLWKLFKSAFGFDVGDKPLELTSTNPRCAFRDAFGDTLARATAKEGESNLLILYYGGHASIEDGWNRKVTWDCDTEGTHKIYWSSFQDQLEEAGCDLLFIFDCEFGGAMINPDWNFPAKCELLCSSSPKVKTVSTKDRSFTAAMVSVLTKEIEEDGFYDINTLSCVLNDTKWIDSLETDPWYAMYTKPPQASIILHSLDRTKIKATPRMLSWLQTMSDARVLLQVSFLNHKSESLSVLMTQFLRLPSSHVSNIEAYARSELLFHGYFRTRSRVGIVSLPLWLWNLMPASPAYEFISIIRGEGLVSDVRS